MIQQSIVRWTVACAAFSGLLPACSAADTAGSPPESLATTSQAQRTEQDDSDHLDIRSVPTATVTIFVDAVFGDFFVGDTVIRADDDEDCVARVRSGFTVDSPAGTMTIGGSFVGQPNGPPVPIVINPDPTQFNQYIDFEGAPPFVFPNGQRATVTLQTTGSRSNPAIELTRLRSADESTLQITSPVVPPSGVVTVPSTQPLEITWPADKGREHNKMVVALWGIAGFKNIGEVRCGFDIRKGHGALPASLLAAVKARVSPPSPLSALLRIFPGDWREIREGDVSYVVELGSPYSTGVVDVSATLQ